MQFTLTPVQIRREKFAFGPEEFEKSNNVGVIWMLPAARQFKNASTLVSGNRPLWD